MQPVWFATIGVSAWWTKRQYSSLALWRHLLWLDNKLFCTGEHEAGLDWRRALAEEGDVEGGRGLTWHMLRACASHIFPSLCCRGRAVLDMLRDDKR